MLCAARSAFAPVLVGFRTQCPAGQQFSWYRESSTAFDEGQRLVAGAVARGVWTRTDRVDLTRVGRGMSDEELTTLQLRVAPAVNQDQLKLELP